MELIRPRNYKTDEYEVMVLRMFVAKVLLLRSQRDTSWHGGKYLRYRLLATEDVMQLHGALQDSVLRTTQKLIRGVSNGL